MPTSGEYDSDWGKSYSIYDSFFIRYHHTTLVAEMQIDEFRFCKAKKLPESQELYRGFARMIADRENANFNVPRIDRCILIRVNQR